MLQFMDYEFVIRRKTRFASRVDAVAAFQKEGFTLIDGSVVADAKWEEWIPKKITETDRAGVVANLGLTLGRRTTVRLAREFRVETGSKSAFNYDIPFIPPAKVPPPDQREPLFRTRIRDADPTFQTSHPFPQFIRFGYGDVDKFLDGYLWKFTKVVTKGGEVLHVHGDRVVYTAAIPITDAANALFFNFEPKEGGDLPFHQGLNEDDTRFFLTVPE